MDAPAGRREFGKGETKLGSMSEMGIIDDDCCMTRVVDTSRAERPATSKLSASLPSSRRLGGNAAKGKWRSHAEEEEEEEEEEDCVILGEAKYRKRTKLDEAAAMVDEDAGLAWALAAEESERGRESLHPLSSTGPGAIPGPFDGVRLADDTILAAALAAEEEALRKGFAPSSSRQGPGNGLSASDEARLAGDASLAAALAAEEEAEAQLRASLPSSSTGRRRIPGVLDEAIVAADASLAAALAAEEEEQERGRLEHDAAAHQVAHDSEEFPDLVSLFLYYNDLYFDGTLLHCIVQWSSPRMTLCAGVCCFDGAMCTIRLSEPLLKYRPLKDMKETLLHEMIHAFIFLKKPGHTHEDHGPMFCGIMERINQSTVADRMRPDGGYKISVYHTFHDEVDHYRKHHWTCDGCKRVVRRAMNRPPSLADCFSRRMKKAANGSEAPCTHPSCLWHRHIQTCGGSFVKTAEPEKATRGKGGKAPGPGGPEKPSVSIADMFRKRAEELGQKREPGLSQGGGQVGFEGSSGTQKGRENVKKSGRGGRHQAQGETGAARKGGNIQVKIEVEEESKSNKRPTKKGAQEQSGNGGEKGAQGKDGAQTDIRNGTRKGGGDGEGQLGSRNLSGRGTCDAVDGSTKAQPEEFGAEWENWEDNKEFRLMQEQILASCQAAASARTRKP